MRHTFLSFIFILAAGLLATAPSRAAQGDWHIYGAYHEATQTAVLDGTVYVLSAGGLYSYSPDDQEVRTYDKVSPLSDSGIFAIRACKTTGELVILYENGNIDLLSPATDEVYNLPDLKTKALSDRTLNDVLETDGLLYVSTGSGIVCVDLKSRTFGDFYNWSKAVRSVAVKDGGIYAAAEDGIYYGRLSDNLLDPANWAQLKTYDLRKLMVCGGRLYGMATNAIYYVHNEANFNIRNICSDRCTGWATTADETLWAFKSGADYVWKITGDTADGAVQVAMPPTAYLSYAGGTYWAACDTLGLLGLTADGTVTVQSIIPASPRRNYAYRFCRPSDGRLLVTGGAFIYPEVKYDGTVMRYEGGAWSAFDEAAAISFLGEGYYRNVSDIVQDPADASHHWVASAASGLYEFRDFKAVAHYGAANSPLTSILPTNQRSEYYVRVTGLSYDDDGNLWMLNNGCDTIVRILRPDGSWLAYHYDEIASYPTLDHVYFDRRGWAWINSRRGTGISSAGFLVVNTNGTVGTQRDDTHRFISTFSNQDGTSYSPILFNCFAEDHDGAMWMGCNRGLFVSYDPASVFDSDFCLTQIKVARNDGTGLADYLLSDVDVSCICVDGGNRKWIGTSDNGVYLISADGQETLHHFTSDNSSLVGDAIYDINIDGETGEVFFATDAGICSYIADATTPADSWDEDNVKVYPNPVRPEYSGPITVNGLMADSDVKIVNAAGRLVNRGTSVGGTYTWDGCLPTGKRCASGVYFVLTADSEGNDGVAAKFLLISQ